MNKRIKELAEQAVEETQLLMLMEYKSFESELYERFAKLIVQDCLKIVEQRTKGPYDVAMTTETRNAWNIWINIKEHFGVKDE